MNGLAGILAQHLIAEKSVVGAPTAARRALLAPPVATLDDHRNRDAYQRPHVGRQPSVAAGDQNHFVFPRQMRHHLLNPRVFGTGEGFQPFEQTHLVRCIQRGQRIVRQVQGMCRPLLFERADPLTPLLPGGGDGAHRRGGIGQRRQTDVIRISKCGFFAAHRTHANPGIDVEAARLDNALLQAPRLGAAVLKIEIGVVDGVGRNMIEHAGQRPGVETIGCQQALGGLLEQGLFFIGHVDPGNQMR